MEPFRLWLLSTRLSMFVRESDWVWPVSESIHFLGLSLLIGTVGLFDLRLLGMAKGVPIAALHRLIRWGIFGFVLNLLTGILFIAAAPDQYFYNTAFQFKVLFVTLAGVNVLVFYSVVFRKVALLGAGADTPRAAKVIGATSLTLWIGVICCGRLLTFFRPPSPTLPSVLRSLFCFWCEG